MVVIRVWALGASLMTRSVPGFAKRVLVPARFHARSASKRKTLTGALKSHAIAKFEGRKKHLQTETTCCSAVIATRKSGVAR